MEYRLVTRLSGNVLAHWTALLMQSGLHCETLPERTLLVYDGERLVASGSRDGNVLKYIFVAPEYQGNDLVASVLSQLRQDAFYHGISHLFLYTKPANNLIFSSLMFYPVAKTDSILLMESEENGVRDYLAALPPADPSGKIGSVVMNGNPFTLGHRYLVEKAAKECETVYVFVLSEDRSRFPFHDRFAMARDGLADLENVLVVPSGPYLISSASFPTYFLKTVTDATALQCQLDAEIFLRLYAPALHITDRYVGTEPICDVTATYNAALRSAFAGHGIAFHEVSRIEANGAPVSASAVRAALELGDNALLKSCLPDSTMNYLKTHNYV